MRSFGTLILITLLSLILHVFLGWMWTAVAGVAGGLASRRLGWVIGLAAVTLAWAILVGYTFVVSPGATAEMARIFGSIVGNLPGAATVAGGILIGAVIGALGGTTGQLLLLSFSDRT